MAIKSPKNKGSSGEREVCALLTAWALDVGVRLSLDRNLEQVRAGGADINGVEGLAIEVKRVENLDIKAAWKQVCRAAAATSTHPMLIHRRNRQPWRVRTYVKAAMQVGGAWKLVPLVVDLEQEQAREWFAAYVQLTYGVQNET